MTTPTPARADWQQVKALFDEVLALPPAQRREFLLAVTADDAVRAEVLSLLAHAEAAEAEGTVLPEASAGARDVDVVIAASALVGQRLGLWTLTGPLGHGGMGDVLRARRSDGAYERQAAIKILKRGMDSAALLARFAQEQRALARLNHPHIARLFDAGLTPDQRPYFVMDLVEGQAIDRAVQGRTLDERLRLFLQLADAVAYAHRQLLVHRDLKPSNVLVDGQGQVKLLDFGIAKALEAGDADAATTQQGQRPFTPHYASPEQVRGEPVGTGTDIYSLGVLLYQLLTGLRPYGRDATTPQAAARCVLEESPTKPSALSPSLNADPQWLATRRRLAGDLDNILLKALEKPIERRYATVEALAADVQAFLDGYPVSARPASMLYLLRKFVARNRWAVLAGSLDGIGLVTGLAAALLQGREAAALGVIGLAGGLGVALAQGRQATLARDLAQTRLAQTRAIASDVMVRHADAIHYLPGGLTLKAELLKNMIAHLDRLALQADADAAFAGELAMAYSRLAELQSENLLASTREGQASDANAIKALALFEAGRPAGLRRQPELQHVVGAGLAFALDGRPRARRLAGGDALPGTDGGRGWRRAGAPQRQHRPGQRTRLGALRPRPVARHGIADQLRLARCGDGGLCRGRSDLRAPAASRPRQRGRYDHVAAPARNDRRGAHDRLCQAGARGGSGRARAARGRLPPRHLATRARSCGVSRCAGHREQ